jgi:hypothetical protein
MPNLYTSVLRFNSFVSQTSPELKHNGLLASKPEVYKIKIKIKKNLLLKV